MQLEEHPDKNNKVVMTPESQQEITLLISAIIPRSHFRYYKAMKKLHESRGSDEMPRISLTKNQLRWIGKRLAPWEKHILPSASTAENIELAHTMSIEINGFLNPNASN